MERIKPRSCVLQNAMNPQLLSLHTPRPGNPLGCGTWGKSLHLLCSFPLSMKLLEVKLCRLLAFCLNLPFPSNELLQFYFF